MGSEAVYVKCPQADVSAEMRPALEEPLILPAVGTEQVIIFETGQPMGSVSMGS